MNNLEPIIDLCRQLNQLQTRAEALGIFLDDRELNCCPRCGLFEDVTAEGILITSRDLATPPTDTGLRFLHHSPTSFLCPDCGTICSPKQDPDDEEWAE